jgi:phage shock protein A
VTEPSKERTPEPIEAEIVPDPVPAAAPAPDYDEHGVPSLDYLRNKIESRYATSLGATELAEGTAAGRSVEEQEAERAAAAKAKLEELRRSL